MRKSDTIGSKKFEPKIYINFLPLPTNFLTEFDHYKKIMRVFPDVQILPCGAVSAVPGQLHFSCCCRGTISIPPHWTPDNNYHYSEHLGFLFWYKTLSAAQRQSQASYMRSQKAASPCSILTAHFHIKGPLILNLKYIVKTQIRIYKPEFKWECFIITNKIRFRRANISYTHIGESVTKQTKIEPDIVSDCQHCQQCPPRQHCQHCQHYLNCQALY